MLFNSWQFVFFFIVVSFLYFSVPFRARWLILLTASYYFYMCWKVEYVTLLFTSTVVVYYCAILMAKSSSENQKKVILIFSLFINLGFLSIFKYFNFISESIQTALSNIVIDVHISPLSILLPIGISFYTFRMISYSVDVYRGTIQPERHFGIFALYVSFFPSLLAGPIDRAVHLIPQFYRKYKFDKDQMYSGMQLIIWGLFKKVVIADRLALYVSSAYGDIGSQSGLNLILATYFYTFQIYCDFSGYSDMAIGSAKLFGFDLKLNFNNPYFATSITDFWRRWHVSLSNWFRDYLYIPLGGNRNGTYRTLINLMITMLFCGLWHGASWLFVIWGGLHGLMLCLSRLTLSYRDRIYNLLQIPSAIKHILRIIITFHIVNFLWIFFRAKTASDAFLILSKIYQFFAIDLIQNDAINYASMVSMRDFLLLSTFIILMFVYEKIQLASTKILNNKYIDLISFSFIFWGILVWGSFSNQQFIYFQF